MVATQKLRVLLIASVVFLATVVSTGADDACKAVYGSGDTVIRLATGSPGELGLVEEIADAFNRTHDTRICWRKAGSGKSLKLLKAKQVDVVMVHAPAAEKQAVAEGWAIKRSLLGSNEFFIVGPKDDPAGIASATRADQAYVKIAAAKVPFFSRGDNSGTHKKEMAIWKRAGVVPAGDWYRTSGTFMMATLTLANDQGGYFMTDSSTWVAGKKEMRNLAVLFRGDPVLVNTYHALCQPAGATVNQAAAAAFVDFLASDPGQSQIRTYGQKRFGEGLYNDAAYARQYE
jgi:tungstate transport system substrate-binding protein